MSHPPESPLPAADRTRLESWMNARGLGSGPLLDLRPIGGGTQNVMVHFTRDNSNYVLRRGPVHLRAVSNRVIGRETEVLQALAATAVPHPRLIAACDETTVLDGAVFYLMESVDGFNASQELPELHRSEPDLQRGMADALIDALAALGNVDHHAVGLTSFGRPDGFIERQVGRWSKELASYAAISAYPAAQLPGLEELAKWLSTNRPSRWTPGIMHGDFHAANVMFARDRAEVPAIVDWEMATIGDPLLDLGWLAATWQLPDAPSVFGGPFMASAHIPGTRVLVERYARQTARDLSALDWYVVLACFKLGILLEGTYARSFAGEAPVEVGRALHRVTLQLLERGLAARRGDW